MHRVHLGNPGLVQPDVRHIWVVPTGRMGRKGRIGWSWDGSSFAATRSVFAGVGSTTAGLMGVSAGAASPRGGRRRVRGPHRSHRMERGRLLRLAHGCPRRGTVRRGRCRDGNARLVNDRGVVDEGAIGRRGRASAATASPPSTWRVGIFATDCAAAGWASAAMSIARSASARRVCLDESIIVRFEGSERILQPGSTPARSSSVRVEVPDEMRPSRGVTNENRGPTKCLFREMPIPRV